MATFNIVLDKGTKLKGDKYNLAIRMVYVNDVMYINVSKMTENQYDQVFIKKFKDKESIAFRDKCNGYISKWERIFSEFKHDSESYSRMKTKVYPSLFFYLSYLTIKSKIKKILNPRPLNH